ncbi:hypothetical protein [Bosea sp. LjRoot237]|uniref:hypothetical protein n=1 Tax=Bosea sp. LjRoot237 TaxID=3342292 RepID=UPI003ECCD53A
MERPFKPAARGVSNQRGPCSLRHEKKNTQALQYIVRNKLRIVVSYSQRILYNDFNQRTFQDAFKLPPKRPRDITSLPAMRYRAAMADVDRVF